MTEVQPGRLPLNAPGKYYTTEECDGCAYCTDAAPENVEHDKSTNTYFVCRQPETEEEEQFMQEAVRQCPVDAIQMSDDRV
jgi:ferredoxin